MSLTPEDLRQHCQRILQSSRIKNKIVVLCEGAINLDKNVRRSPILYGKMEQMPDSNFYKACVPRRWTQYQPQFFNCGDRKDVIDTYSMLLELQDQDKNNSYLSPQKLFAFVDLDLTLQEISNYSFPHTEAIFKNLYQQGKVNQETAKQHRIWVTGLIHKEAYFLIPELQSVFDNYPNPPVYNGNRLSLHQIYLDIAKQIETDCDLETFFKRAVRRINYCSGLDCAKIDCLQKSWEDCFHSAPDDTRKNELIFALLTIEKAKKLWKEIQPPSDWTSSSDRFREQLSLEIGRFYSAHSEDTRYHIAFFLKTLYDFMKI